MEIKHAEIDELWVEGTLDTISQPVQWAMCATDQHRTPYNAVVRCTS